MNQETKTKAQGLLKMLGVSNYTERHLQATVDFLDSGEKDGAKLLDQLGTWDHVDLEIVNTFIR